MDFILQYVILWISFFSMWYYGFHSLFCGTMDFILQYVVLWISFFIMWYFGFYSSVCGTMDFTNVR
jgi:hypothetical protein